MKAHRNTHIYDGCFLFSWSTHALFVHPLNYFVKSSFFLLTTILAWRIFAITGGNHMDPYEMQREDVVVILTKSEGK